MQTNKSRSVGGYIVLRPWTLYQQSNKVESYVSKEEKDRGKQE